MRIEKGGHELVERDRHVRNERGQARCRGPMTRTTPVDRGAGLVERKPTGRCFVQRDAEAVPIGGRREGFTSSLLGRNVTARPEQHAGAPGAAGTRRNARGQAEVEQDHAPRRSDDDVRRLDVAVQHAVCVHGRKRRCELRGRCQERTVVAAIGSMHELMKVRSDDELHAERSSAILRE
jgi:hypothetical protein